MDAAALSVIDTRNHSRPVVTNDDLAPVLQVITWMLLAAMFLSCLIRLLSRRYLLHNSSSDDALVVLAFLFAVGQSICVVLPGGSIWGLHIHQISPDALSSGLKTEYVNHLLFYPGLFFAKTSTALAIFRISPDKRHKGAVTATGVAATIWIVTTEIALAFQCSLPHPWAVGETTCNNRLVILLFANIGSILTDAALVALPIWIVMPARMRLPLRLFSVTMLSARVLVFAAAIVQTAYLPQSLDGDFTFDAFPYNIASEIVQALSVVTCSLPFFATFMKGLRSGAVFTDDRNVHGIYKKAVDATTNKPIMK